MKNLTWITFLILLQLSLSLPAQTPSPERVMFEPSIRKIPVSGAQTGGSLSPTVVRPTLTQAETQAPLSFSIPLKMHNLAELQKRISAGEIISAAEMTAKYYPTAADYKLVAAFLTSQGFTVKPANRSFNLSVFASGSVTQIQRAFATSFSRVAFAGVEASSAVTAPSCRLRSQGRHWELTDCNLLCGPDFILQLHRSIHRRSSTICLPTRFQKSPTLIMLAI